MSAEFSANLSTLRKEKNISQKEAAEALGISQALLSHYEKGIRECSLDFVKKAAEYYNVTADYLLGISESKRDLKELLSTDDITDDSSVNSKTLLRCLIFLAETAEKSGDAAQIFFDDYFSLALRKYYSVINRSDKNKERVCDIVSSLLIDESRSINRPEIVDIPLSLKSIEQHTDMLIAQNMAKIL